MKVRLTIRYTSRWKALDVAFVRRFDTHLVANDWPEIDYFVADVPEEYISEARDLIREHADQEVA